MNWKGKSWNEIQNEVFKHYGLSKDEIYIDEGDDDKQYAIFTRPAIEKIIQAEAIDVRLWPIPTHDPRYALVKVEADNGRGGKIETLGEASPLNCKHSFVWSVAEKRGKSRAVLMLVGLYDKGFKGEDEMDHQPEKPSVKDKGKDAKETTKNLIGAK